jgi:hypothetical protein
MGSLSADREPPPMTKAPVASDIHQPLDILSTFPPEISFNHVIFLDNGTDLCHLFFGQIFRPHPRLDAGLGRYIPGNLPPDAIDGSKRDPYRFLFRDIHPNNSGHRYSPLSLFLFMTGVGTDYPYHTFPFNDLASLTESFYRRFYFHCIFLLRKKILEKLFIDCFFPIFGMLIT